MVENASMSHFRRKCHTFAGRDVGDPIICDSPIIDLRVPPEINCLYRQIITNVCFNCTLVKHYRPLLSTFFDIIPALVSNNRKMKDQEKNNWPERIRKIQEDLLMSQSEIATYCGVARQSVTNWKSGFRNPGYYARRKLLELEEKCGNIPGKPDKSNLTGISEKSDKDYAEGLGEFKRLKIVFRRLTPEKRVMLIDYGEYLLCK